MRSIRSVTRKPPTTLIVAVSIPLSIIVTIIAMYFFNLTLNMLSLGGLALGIGMLVDNSIVVLEAIDRRRGQGLSRREASMKGAGEVSGAVTAANWNCPGQIVVSGDLNPDLFLPRLEDLLSGLPSADGPAVTAPGPTRVPDGIVSARIDKKQNQSVVLVAWPGPRTQP